MPPSTVNCPNQDCHAALKLDTPPPAGKKVRCPRCGTAFTPPVEAPAEVAPLEVQFEAEKVCPSCHAAMAPEAILCVQCGFNLRTGAKLEGPKKSSRKKGRTDEKGPLTQENLPQWLEEAEALIELARKELSRLPHVLGLGDDRNLAALRQVANRPNRCDNPNCQTGLTNLGGPSWYTRVMFSARGQKMVVNLCQTCSELLHADLASRDDTALAYLQEARADLERIGRRFPKHPDVESALRTIRKVELLAGQQKPRKRACFIATAAYGSSLAVEVDTLRRYRDEVLERSPAGRCLTRAYYFLSPPLAALVAARPWLRALARGLLGPVVAWCRFKTARPRCNRACERTAFRVRCTPRRPPRTDR